MHEYIVPASVLKDAFGLTDGRRIRQLVQAGVLNKTGRGQYDLIACTKAYCEYLRSRGGLEQDGDENDPRVATTRLKNAQALSYELENQKELGQLLVVTDVLDFLEELQKSYNGSIDALEGRLTSALTTATNADSADILSVLQPELHQCRTETANTLQSLANNWKKDDSDTNQALRPG